MQTIVKVQGKELTYLGEVQKEDTNEKLTLELDLKGEHDIFQAEC